MALPPLSTILNNAPLIIQGANSLLKLLKERKAEKDANSTHIPDVENPDRLKAELSKLHQRLDNTDKSNIQQIEYIEALAKQNESLASTLQKLTKRLNLMAYLVTFALVLAVMAMMFALNA